MLPVFDMPLKRLKLMQMALQPVDKQCSVRVYRNHSFEVTASVLNVFLNLSKIAADISYSDYDDSLNFQFQPADVQIIWLDTNRYGIEDLSAFLEERIKYLQMQSTSPVLLVTVGQKSVSVKDIAGCTYLNLTEALSFMGDNAYDEAKEKYSGTRLSGAGCLEAARILGLRYLPALLKPALKAIVVDLDNTLYHGILGEDGIDALKPYNRVQQRLKDLKQNGFVLCLASKNEETDAKELFAKRTDFILRWEDFTVTAVNWRPKAENILSLAANLNIGSDAILFVDDNPAEIENVVAAGVPVKTILAVSEEETDAQLQYFPGLLKLAFSKEDNLRSADIAANAERRQLAEKLSPEEYFHKLGIKLVFGIDHSEQISRVAELFGKTNQFILTYARYNQAEVAKFMTDPDSCIVTAAMSDNLSDSGIIALLAAARGEKNVLKLKELTVSCRALGRNLENIMLPMMFKLAAETLKTENRIIIGYRRGERNMPAISWLQTLSETELQSQGNICWQLPENIKTEGLEIRVI